MSRTIVALLLCLSSCKPPPAGEPPSKPEPLQLEQTAEAEPVLQETYTFEVGVAWNRHHKFGADGERLYSTVTLMLYEGGKVRIEDGGKRKLSTLDNTYGYEEENTQWSNVWAGTWVRDGGEMVLELDLMSRGCEKVVAGLEGTPEEKEECGEAPDMVTLECKTDGITLEPALDAPAGAPAQTVDAWVCHPTGDDVDLGGTPVAWVFGKDACLEASSGPYGSRSYGPCREDDPI